MCFFHEYLVGGFNPSEKYEFVSWDGLSMVIPSILEKKIHGPNHQPDMFHFRAIKQVS